jgi:hypothetical protein
MKALLLLVSAMILNIVVPLGVQILDKRRLRPEQRERAWNRVSWAAALYAFGPLSMAGWVWVTRQDFWAWWRRSATLALVKGMGLVVIGLGVGAAIAIVNVLLVSLVGGPE